MHMGSEYINPHCVNLGISCVRTEVFTVVTITDAVFWDVTPFGSSKNL
jgi:hypothetical protein